MAAASSGINLVTGWPTLEMLRVTKRFGGHAALTDFTLRVEPGEVVGLVGPNGAGKSTLLHLAAGLISPSEGTVSVAGAGVSPSSRGVACVLEAPGFHPGFTARQTLQQVAEMVGPGGLSLDRALVEVGLADVAHTPVGGFSLGMRQRLAIGACLMQAPALFLLDEPANGLDMAGMRWLRRLVEDWRGAGSAFVISSHLLDELARTADRIVIVNHGRLVADGTLSQLQENASAAVRVETTQPDRLSKQLARRGWAVSTSDSSVLVADASVSEVISELAQSKLPITGVIEVVETLEDAVMRMLEGQQ